MTSSEIIHIKNISKSYAARPIIYDISMEFKRGEIIGLFGPNGAGKTTCFNIIAGLIKPDSGELLYNTQNIARFPIYLRARLGISYLPQEASIFRGLSVFDNIKAILEIWVSGKEEINLRTEELLEEFSLSHLKFSSALSLSGGERRRLEIARMLAGNPKFVMLDEPLAGIDPKAILEIKKIILKLKQRNIGVLITDHNVRDTINLVDHVYIIYDGKVLVEGPPEEIINCDEVKDVYLGHSFNI